MKDSKTKVKIICSKHGEFLQTPNSHLSGRGCPKCAGTNAINADLKYRSYDYSKVKYVNFKTPVSIICPTHGEFIEKAIKIHGNKYDYSKVEYKK